MTNKLNQMRSASVPSRIPVKRGFTLVEMLVVLAIIALLTSLVIPATQGAMERARSAACRANLRKLTKAWLSFCSDNNGYSIKGEYWQWQRGDIFWRGELQPYLDVTNPKNIMCPSIKGWDPEANQTMPGLGTAHTAYRGAFMENGEEKVLEGGYAFNDRLVNVDPVHGAWWVGPHAYYRNIITIETPARTPTFSDGIVSIYVGDPVLYAPPHFPFIDGGFGGLQRIAVDRHNQGINMAFADGHVRHVRLADLYTFKYGRDTPNTPPDVSQWFPPGYR